MKYPERRIHMY